MRLPLPYLGRRVLWEACRRTMRTVTTSTKQGRLSVFTADRIIGQNLFCVGGFENEWVKSIVDFLRARGKYPADGSATVLDIGANIGVISIGMLVQGLASRAIAVEADPRNYQLMLKNVRQNGLADQVFAIQRAASASAGDVLFELSQDNFGDHRVRVDTANAHPQAFNEAARETISVKSEPLDRLLDTAPADFRSPLHLVWMDVQGHEGHVIAGGKQTFRSGVPVWTEIWPYGMARAGFSVAEFCRLAADIWPYYWHSSTGTLERYDAARLADFTASMTTPDDSTNVLFTDF